jgi:hypothetical protein
MSIPFMLLRNILPKISYYQVSQNNDDYKNISSLFEEVSREIDYATGIVEIDFRSEIIAATKLNSEKKGTVN